MPTIWNVNNEFNTSNRKLSSKLTFQVGEKFSGKIVSKNTENEVELKLSDGWQFSAELDGKYSFDEGQNLRFEVVGYENGKLMLKLSEDKNTEKVADIKNNLLNILKKEGLPKSDIKLLTNMIEHNIQLTRENIAYVKSILEFVTKIKNDPKEMDNFINNFLQSKNIDPSSEEGISIREKLVEFLNEFKSLSNKDILMFLENNIQINKENIDSYNNIFNRSGTLKEYFDNILSGLTEFDEGNNINIEQQSVNIISTNKESNLQEKGPILNNINNVASKIYDKIGSESEKANVLNLLKSMMNSQEDAVKGTLNNILSDRMDGFSIAEYKTALNNISNEEIVNELKSFLLKNELDKEEINNIISKIFNKEVNLTDKEINKITDMVEYVSKKDKVVLEENLTNILSNKGEKFTEEDIKLIQNNLKNLDNPNLTEKALKDIISNVLGKEIDLTKEEVESLFKSLNFEKSAMNEKADLDIELKQTLEEAIKISTKDNVRKEFAEKIGGVRDTIKEIIKLVEGSKLEGSKVLEFIKSNINDFKLFNSISNEYYYLDIPLNNNGNEYPCKLIIKDNRKAGKQIDKNNIKLVVTIDTANLGGVDGYLTIHNTNVNIELRCEEKVMTKLDKNKKQLVEGLRTLGLNANIFVTKRKEEVNIATCRGFFDSGSNMVIDRRV